MARFKYNSAKYKEWRESIYSRDKHKCQLCGEIGGKINAHHIKRKADVPSLAYEKTNGITLCVQCHAVVTGHEKLFEPLLQKIVDRTILVDYIVGFFYRLSTRYKPLVGEFKKYNKWLLIAENLIKKVKKTKHA